MAKKCPVCNSCKKYFPIENNLYLGCTLCLRVWRIDGSEISNTEQDIYGNNIVDKFKELISILGI
jgi:hypothetical protein